jgi:hypothetical protein
MKFRAAYILVGTVIAAGITLAAFTLESFPSLSTSVAGLTTNLCTNVTARVDEMDTLSMQFRGALAGTGAAGIQLRFRRGYETNAFDTTNAFTWTISTIDWVSGSTNLVSTNLVSVRDFRFLQVFSVGNGNTGDLSLVQLSYGSK